MISPGGTARIQAGARLSSPPPGPRSLENRSPLVRDPGAISIFAEKGIKSLADIETL